MPNYRRSYQPGGCWFFTVNLQNRRSDLLVQQFKLLSQSLHHTQTAKPFKMLAWVVLPEHLHTIWRLPATDSDYASRWQLLKLTFSRELHKNTGQSTGHQGKIWQRGYWEHLIRNDADFKNHFDYVHRNPLKHQLVRQVQDWPLSSFHHYVKRGIYPPDWCG